MGWYGWSLMSQPSTTGISASRNPISERIRRDVRAQGKRALATLEQGLAEVGNNPGSRQEERTP